MKKVVTKAQPAALAVLRIMTALLYMQHGLQKLFHFPVGGHHPGPLDWTSWVPYAGLLETVGGLCIALGLFTRPAAFLLSGQMAVAYFTVYFLAGLKVEDGFFPVVNQGELAIMYCFFFLYLIFSGPGAWSLDRHFRKADRD